MGIFAFRYPTRVSRATQITRARDCCSSLRSRTRACSQPPGQPGLLIGARWAAGRNSSALKARATMRAERSTFRTPTNQISKTSVYSGSFRRRRPRRPLSQDRNGAIASSDREGSDEIPAPTFSASGSGCCRASGILAHGDRANLSVTASAHHSRPWCPLTGPRLPASETRHRSRLSRCKKDWKTFASRPDMQPGPR
jgi:hypothetical protein